MLEPENEGAPEERGGDLDRASRAKRGLNVRRLPALVPLP